MEKLRLGVIGLGQRGSCLIQDTIPLIPELIITAVCDVYKDRTVAAAETIRAQTGTRPREYANYADLLADGHVDGVIISTSWNTHAEIAAAAMRAGKITALEVGGAYCIEDCFLLIKTYEATKTPFMLLENCCYDKGEQLALNMTRAGLFGEIVHCSGIYAHDLREEIAFGRENRHYRLDNYLKRNCENYPTHELGPIAKVLGINNGNRMLSLVSVASKAAGMDAYLKHNDKADPSLRNCSFRQGDIVSTIISCAGGETISLQLDTTLPRLYDRAFTVRGTRGLYNQTWHMVYIDGVHEHSGGMPYEYGMKYFNNAVEYEKEFLPMYWLNATAREMQAGHGGMDLFMLRDFADCALNGKPMPIDVFDAAAWMSVTALSEKSIALGGQSVEIPDFTSGRWITPTRGGAAV